MLSNIPKKALAIRTPFSVVVISIFVVTILTHSYSSLLDKDWINRQFLIGMFMFTGLTIIPRLLHIQLFLSGVIPSLKTNLGHHPPSLQSTHEIQIKGHSICSGCFGSFLSILIAEMIFFLYFLNPLLFNDNLAIIYLFIDRINTNPHIL